MRADRWGMKPGVEAGDGGIQILPWKGPSVTNFASSAWAPTNVNPTTFHTAL